MNDQPTQREEQHQWQRLRQELKAGIEADESEFVVLYAGAIIAEARERRRERSSGK